MQCKLEHVKSNLKNVQTNLRNVRTNLETVKSNLETVQTNLETVKFNLENEQTNLDIIKLLAISLESYTKLIRYQCTVSSKINGTPKGVTAKIKCCFEMGK